MVMSQVTKCFICQSVEHQVKDCPTVKCWRCGNLGHKARECQYESGCSLCGHRGHTSFNCPIAVVQWSCFVTIKKCPMSPCNEDETLEHLLLHCNRIAEIRHKMVSVGFTVHCNVKSVMYGLFRERLTDSKR
uniref:CCHC-type domain-containing protein n=1 Tax=Mola mola TaxID=94237 RepID=A0A3Q3XJ09_MOLML